MKKCVYCGAKMKDQALVCTKCGNLQPEDRSQPAPQQQEVPQPVRQQVRPAAAPDPAEREFPVIMMQAPAPAAPICKLKTNRGMVKYVFLTLITFGIYGIVAMSDVTEDINIIASRYDGRRTMHFCLITFIFSWLTLGIAPFVWAHRMCDRIGNELARRGIAYQFGAGAFWIWNILGSLILVGPFVYLHKLCKAMNLLGEDYKVNG